MNDETKVRLKAELTTIQMSLFNIDAMISAASAAANMPIITPTGPAMVPGLTPVVNAMRSQKELTDKLLKFLEKLFDEM